MVVAEVEVAFTIVRLVIVDEAALITCPAVHVLAWARFKDATTAPVVGEMVSVPSLLETEVTDPEVLRHVPFTAKQPAERLMPFAKVDDAPLPCTLMILANVAEPKVVVETPTPKPCDTKS